MLNRRRFMTMCGGGFRWIKVKISMAIKSLAQLGFGHAANAKSKRSTSINHTASLTAFDIGELAVDTKVDTTTDVQLNRANTTELNISNKVGVSVIAKLVGYLRAPFEYFKKIKTSHKAKLNTVDTSECASSTSVKNGCNATGNSAETNSAVISVVTPQPKATAAVSISAAQTAGTQIMPKTKHSANLSWWIYPELDENGCLYIRQAYGLTLNGTELEVI